MARIDRLPWRVLAGVALALIGLTLGFFWFRDSSFAAVQRVSISGSGSSEVAQVRDALQTAARGMSTLAIDDKELRAAVESFSSVADLRIEPRFPHELDIEVVEHRPVANVESGGSRVPATGGGLLLDGVRSDEVPTIASRTAPAEGRVQDGPTLAALRVAAAAPGPLLARAERVTTSEKGLAVELRDGPELRFGDARAAREKWRAAARVLADGSSAGAVYLDLRVPHVVAAGGVGPITPAPTPTPTVVPSEPSTVG